jgi:hypothetical protein
MRKPRKKLAEGVGKLSKLYMENLAQYNLRQMWKVVCMSQEEARQG